MPLFGCLHWQALLGGVLSRAENAFAPLVCSAPMTYVGWRRLGRQFYVLPRTRMGCNTTYLSASSRQRSLHGRFKDNLHACLSSFMAW